MCLKECKNACYPPWNVKVLFGYRNRNEDWPISRAHQEWPNHLVYQFPITSFKISNFVSMWILGPLRAKSKILSITALLEFEIFKFFCTECSTSVQSLSIEVPFTIFNFYIKENQSNRDCTEGTLCEKLLKISVSKKIEISLFARAETRHFFRSLKWFEPRNGFKIPVIPQLFVETVKFQSFRVDKP